MDATIGDDAPRPPVPARIDAGADPVALLDGVPLTADEAGYVEAARAANTLRGYRSDWREFTAWCTQRHVAPLPAAPATVTRAGAARTRPGGADKTVTGLTTGSYEVTDARPVACTRARPG